MRVYINNDWYFTEEFSDKLLEKGTSGMKQVRLPHTVKETPLHYFDENVYQMISGYKKVLDVPKEWKDKSILITFDGIAHDAKVYVNGRLSGEHHTGYTAFTIEISEMLDYGKKNEITVRCDSRETLNTPPFGYVIDYMTYGGIYRDVYIEVKNKTYIQDIFIYTRLADLYKESEEYDKPVRFCRKSNIVSEIKLNEGSGEEGYSIRQSIRKTTDDPSQYAVLGRKDLTEKVVFVSGSVELWDIENPVLYLIRTELYRGDELLDEREDRIGFRQMSFKVNGFYLNGRKVKLRGLNRHQSYPYVGYAMPESMQKLDADILKKELGLNAVRTSHYPQSQHFIDRCDEIGLLVFTEMPGWQHIGDSAWKEQAVENLREMVVQYRNHPSIMLWGVRINESVDDDEFYSNKCLVTVKNKGNVLRLTNKQIEDLLYLLEHSCTKTQEKGGFRDDINEDAPLYIDVQYESEICLQNDKGNSFNIYRIIYTYDDKFNNKLTYHIRNDSIGFHYYNMSNSDMKKLEHILNISFND